MQTLEWTDTPPESPGWYWAERMAGDRIVVHVVGDGPHGFVVDLGGPNWWPLESTMMATWRWAGPITEPK